LKKEFVVKTKISVRQSTTRVFKIESEAQEYINQYPDSYKQKMFLYERNKTGGKSE